MTSVPAVSGPVFRAMPRTSPNPASAALAFPKDELRPGRSNPGDEQLPESNAIAGDADEIQKEGEEADEDAQAAPSQPKKKRLGGKKRNKQHRRGKKKQRQGWRRNGKRDAKHPDAPFNTTQFIMNDHGDTIQFLDKKLGVTPECFLKNVNPGDAPAKRVITRARESSFSLDSDSDYYYSSPEDEEEFVCKEFLKDYNNVRADRLVTLSKTDLINEYIQMETRIDSLEKRLARAKQREEVRKAEASAAPVEIQLTPELAEKIRIFQSDIQELKMENHGLRLENLALLRQKRRQALGLDDDEPDGEESMVSSSSSISDEESCSSCSSSSSGDSSSSDEEEATLEEAPEPPLAQGEDGLEPSPPDVSDETAQDTGYESGQSGNNAGQPVVTSTSTASQDK
eukprot:snap_masked-scaffold964_size76271-processed-gene-0.7 protein:Tk09570 transcript:snap_masked-scaffold964_size76271-processed-gene-0.7-mRNA-1 annotation:"protein hexim isoform x1"